MNVIGAKRPRPKKNFEEGDAVKVTDGPFADFNGTVDEVKPTRTLDQNAKLWAVLTDISRQVEWHVDGRMQKLEPEDWKDILSAGVKKSQRVAAGIEGGFVMLGQRTSKMRVGEMVELIEFALWFGTEHGVTWGEEKAA